MCGNCDIIILNVLKRACAYHFAAKEEVSVTIARICFAVLLCVPLLLCVEVCFEKLVNEINKKRREQ